ncbi:hypothetical protein MUN82_06335 [Hymenobacter aerilatus]|uniref:ATP-binding protein n=1 Tax=Hymenobacter aerilatus TaxID=2932251 RepID=A0A8T9SWW2_9BACT|nr:hypothetical protein [Hymenobacter aerilatus]UOR06712.1 hypothetical protein MUN82_06335 [Hymenobacter aerilatus]
MPRIKTNVIGKVGNISLSYDDGIMALHEAIVNSLQSIDSAKRPDGEIVIDVRRDPTASPEFDGLPPVKDIVIRDNGVGFNRKNYNSFQTAESTYKLKIGGKGIGRFLWLKVFDRAEVRSVFKEYADQKLHNRSFSFVLDNRNPIVDERLVPLPNGNAKPIGTSIKLCELRPEYAECFSGPLAELADSIIEHHIHFLVDDSCPEIVLREERPDKTSSVQFDLKRRFLDEFLLDKDADSIQIDNYTFEIAFLKIKSDTSKPRHTLLYSANKRVVTSHSEALATLIPNLSQPLKYETGELFDIYVLVSSSYFDQHVNRERTKLDIPAKPRTNKVMGKPLLSLAEIQEQVIERTYEHLEGYLTEVRQEKHEHFKRFVETTAPQYRSLLQYVDRLDKIKPGLSDEKLDIELHKLRNELVLETKQDLSKILHESEAQAPNTEEFTKDLNKLMGMINNVTQTNLVDYVLQRKMILMLFERVLKLRDDSKYELEERIHNIVFPMEKNSDHVAYEDHNLWLIDERLAYHKFLRSDEPLDVEDDNAPRPDIVAGFENNLLYTDREAAPYDSFTIIEFKRPMRKNYGKEEDPIAQVQRYLAHIQSGDATTNDGRPINPSGAKFYCYIICDLTKRIRAFAKDRGCTASKDNEGYFWYNQNYSAYIELISFDKLVKDSKQRNQILFDKLGIGHA